MIFPVHFDCGVGPGSAIMQASRVAWCKRGVACNRRLDEASDIRNIKYIYIMKKKEEKPLSPPSATLPSPAALIGVPVLAA